MQFDKPLNTVALAGNYGVSLFGVYFYLPLFESIFPNNVF